MVVGLMVVKGEVLMLLEGLGVIGVLMVLGPDGCVGMEGPVGGRGVGWMLEGPGGG